MRPKNTDPEHQVTDRGNYRGIHYRWTSDGAVCSGHTVITSTTRSGLRSALRRFWRANLHVQPA